MEFPCSALAIVPGSSADSLEATLEDIFSEPVWRVREREKTEVDRLLAAANWQCVLFGAGNLGSQSLAALQTMGVRPIAISDNNPELWGTSIEGIPLLPPREAAERFGKSAHFFVSIRNERHWYRETLEQLTKLGCTRLSSAAPIAWRFLEKLPSFLLYDQPHKLYEQADRVLRAAEIWADDASRDEYLAQIRLRALGDPSGLSQPAAEESYFLDGIFEARSDDVFVDCGAFDGDTIRSVIYEQRQFARIEAIEADSHSFARLAEYVATLEPQLHNKIRVHQCAIGSRQGPVRFEDTGRVDSKISDVGQIVVDMVPLDVMFEWKSVSMIKMDIEGGEFDALLGAQQVTQRDRPILAICVYHCQEDIWRLPLLMQRLCPEYRMYLRAYRGDGIQTVAYAVPPERILR
ncbi:MAG: FkbM family methyltransferase [Acidobacteriaceae bacterium]